MSTERRKKNANWLLDIDGNGQLSNSHAQLAVLMDIRDELQGIRRRLDCSETLEIPRILKKIRANTTKRRRKKK